MDSRALHQTPIAVKLPLTNYLSYLPQLSKGDEMFFSTKVFTDKESYSPKDIISATVEAINNSLNSIEMTFFTGQKYDFIITNKNGKEVFRWSDKRLFSQLVSKIVVAPNEKITYTEKLELGPKKLKAGEYMLEGIITAKDFKVSDVVTEGSSPGKETADSERLSAKIKLLIQINGNTSQVGFIYRKVSHFGTDCETPVYYLETFKGQVYELIKDNPRFKLDDYLEQFVRAWPNHFKVKGCKEHNNSSRIIVKEIQPTEEL